MRIETAIKKLNMIYPRAVYNGFKLMIREDGDVYIYLPEPDGDGWYKANSFDTFAAFVSWIKGHTS